MSKRVALIERISSAANSQTAVTRSDKTSNDPLHGAIQNVLFERYGLLYERKRGEFSDGLKNGYISTRDVVSRATFARVYLAALGNLRAALQKRTSVEAFGPDVTAELAQSDRFVTALHAFEYLRAGKGIISNRGHIELLPKVYAASLVAQTLEGDASTKGKAAAKTVSQRWQAFLNFAAGQNAAYVRTSIDPQSNLGRSELRESRNRFGDAFKKHAEEFFGNPTH